MMIIDQVKSKAAFDNSYWCGCGNYQKTYAMLLQHIPGTGPCPANKPKLEKLRRAANAYYQLMNNGNKGEFRREFGFAVGGCNVQGIYFNTRANAKLDWFILEAAVEAGMMITEVEAW